MTGYPDQPYSPYGDFQTAPEGLTAREPRDGVAGDVVIASRRPDALPRTAIDDVVTDTGLAAAQRYLDEMPIDELAILHDVVAAVE